MSYCRTCAEFFYAQCTAQCEVHVSCVSKILKLSEGICDNVIKCDKKIKIQLSVFPSLDVMDVIITKYDIELK